MKPINYPESPSHLWEQFYQISQIPRPSRFEAMFVDYLKNLATERELDFKIDDANNIVLFVPGSVGREDEPSLLIQNHMDMVTDKLVGLDFDFQKMPIELQLQNGWLKAKGTTLGADNGIGCAAALAVMLDDSVSHPPLELLFTSDEETGLHGALNLDSSILTAKRMLNLDTEEWGSLYVGCAGGLDYDLQGDFDTAPILENERTLKITVGGLVGGHSGLDINRQRGNAIKLLTELLCSLDSNFRLLEFRGGRAHNIIPRDAHCLISVTRGDEEKIATFVNAYNNDQLRLLPKDDQGLDIICEVVGEKLETGLTEVATHKWLSLLSLFPHGTHRHDLSLPDVVSMSNNLAKALLINGSGYIMSSLRFFDRQEVVPLERKLEYLSELFNLKINLNSEYPSWKPAVENNLLKYVVETYKKLYNQDPEVTAIHAGLECGIIKDKIGEIDIVSFGPTIMGAHSPDERVELESVTKFWTLLIEILKGI